jgi:Flp pilus assembly protein TadG
MTTRNKGPHFLSRWRHLYRDRRGVAAVEFALILPVMLAVYLGGIQIGEGFAINIKVTEVAHSVADIAAQYISIDNADMSGILNASAQIIAPYPPGNIVVTVSEVTTNSKGVATVTWSDSLNGTARTVGTTITLPTSLQIANISLILGEVSYTYTPVIGYVVAGSFVLSDSYYLCPRLSNSVTRVNS